MSNEIRQAIALPVATEDEIFELFDKVEQCLEKGDIKQAEEIIHQAWALIPEPKYNTSCTGVVLSAMQPVLLKTQNYSYLENVLTHWIADEENSGYKIYDAQPFILLAEVYLYMGDINKAKAQFSKAKQCGAGKRDFSNKPAFYYDIMLGKLSDGEIQERFDDVNNNTPQNDAMIDIDDALNDRLDAMAEEGNALFDDEKYQEAIAIWQSALALIPEPKQFYAKSQWFEIGIADAYMNLDDYQRALDFALSAKGNLADNGYLNPFIMLCVGQCYLEVGDMDNAKEYLLRAYMLDGEDIFAESDKKYWQFLIDNVDFSEPES